MTGSIMIAVLGGGGGHETCPRLGTSLRRNSYIWLFN